jgi:hypothetical protein
MEVVKLGMMRSKDAQINDVKFSLVCNFPPTSANNLGFVIRE